MDSFDEGNDDNSQNLAQVGNLRLRQPTSRGGQSIYIRLDDSINRESKVGDIMREGIVIHYSLDERGHVQSEIQAPTHFIVESEARMVNRQNKKRPPPIEHETCIVSDDELVRLHEDALTDVMKNARLVEDRLLERNRQLKLELNQLRQLGGHHAGNDYHIRYRGIQLEHNTVTKQAGEIRAFRERGKARLKVLKKSISDVRNKELYNLFFSISKAQLPEDVFAKLLADARAAYEGMSKGLEHNL